MFARCLGGARWSTVTPLQSVPPGVWGGGDGREMER